MSLKLQQHKLITREITKLSNSEAYRNLDRVTSSVNKILGCDNCFTAEIGEFRTQWEILVDQVRNLSAREREERDR